jgi:hypothetical protein
MGYTICKSYFTGSSNKKQAIKNIIELNYSDSKAVGKILEMSKYILVLLPKITKPLAKKF